MQPYGQGKFTRTTQTFALKPASVAKNLKLVSGLTEHSSYFVPFAWEKGTASSGSALGSCHLVPRFRLLADSGFQTRLMGPLSCYLRFTLPRALSRRSLLLYARWGVVQLVGHHTVNVDGEGSNPSAPANFPSDFPDFRRSVSPWPSAALLPPNHASRRPSTPRSCSPSSADCPPPAPTGILRRSTESPWSSGPALSPQYPAR